MSKTPYEVRLELIKMAQEQLNQRYYNRYEVTRYNAEVNKQTINEVPEFPDSAQILLEAEKLKTFIDKGDR